LDIKLKRKIDVSKYKVILDIGQKQERKDVIALLLIAKKYNNQLSTKIVCRDFLFRNHEKMAENILRRCIEYEVIDNDYKITEKGFEAIDDRMIYQYYDGVFYLYVTEDQLIPQRILNYEIVEEAINFRNEIKGTNDSEFNLIDTPQWLKELETIEGKVLFNNEKTEINIRSISDKVEFIEKTELVVTVNLSEKSCILRTSGIFNDQRDIEYFPSFMVIWSELMGNQIANWDWNDNKLRISNNLKDSEKSSFKRIINFNNPKINNFGTFDSISLEVNIKPQTKVIADEWANWLLIHNINDFIFEDTLNKSKQKTAELFTEFTINFHSHNTIANQMRQRLNLENIPIEYWFVQAPLDIKPIIKEGE